MFNKMREIVSEGYNLLTHNKDFGVISKFRNSEAAQTLEFANYYKDFERCLHNVRTRLTQLSTETEAMELLIKKMKLHIERELKKEEDAKERSRIEALRKKKEEARLTLLR